MNTMSTVDQLGPTRSTENLSRPERPAFLGFVTDAATEQAVRDGLADARIGAIDVRRGGVRNATDALRKLATPRFLLIDLSGEDEPLVALGKLSETVEPDVGVLVVGDIADLDFYRLLTRSMGAFEYLSKPVTREMVARHFLPLVNGSFQNADQIMNGRLVTISASAGGAGATTIAANLAWHLAADLRRHTLLLDPDLHLGRAAMLLDTQAGPGLRMALEQPDRIDELFVERATRPAAAKGAPERLHVLAAEEKLDQRSVYTQGATLRLMEALRTRYNTIIADTPISQVRFYRDLLQLAHQRVIIVLPTLSSIRDTLRILDLPSGPAQKRRPVLVLNRAGMPGGLSLRQVEEALRLKPDVVFADNPRPIMAAANLGEPALSRNSAFRASVGQLAREVAMLRTGEDGAASTPQAAVTRRARRRLFGARR